MKNHMIKVGTAVPSMKVADVSYNVEQICNMITENRDCGVLVFPELCITGYTCADLFGSEALLDAAEKGLDKIAKATLMAPGLTAAVGMPLRFENSLYNCACFVCGGAVIGIVPKINLPTYSEFYEARWFRSGRDIKDRTILCNGAEVPFGCDLLIKDEKSGAVIGTDICEDLWVPDKPSTHACLAGANIIVNLSASDEVIGKQEYRRSMVSSQSAACYCAYVYVSSGTDESSTDLVFSGHCLIAENGKMLKESIYADRPHLMTAVIDLDTIAYNRAHQNTYDSETDRFYRIAEAHIQPLTGRSEMTVSQMKTALQKEEYEIAKNPFVPGDDAERGRRCQKILQIQANGLATRVRASHIHTLVIGISGGLDSTLALLVCHEAQKIEPEIRIISYTLPNKGNTTSLTYHNAISLMKALDTEIREVSIEKGVHDHLVALGHGDAYKSEGDTTYENAQARMRTYILMDAANMENGLVVGTGDLSELALGWCTYNGDHMSMYGVNGSVPKTLVQYICRTYAETCGNEKLKKILLSIVDTPISPELTPSVNGAIAQKTEEKIGKYDLNDFFLFYTLRYGFDPQKIMAFALTAYPEITKAEMKEAELRFCTRFFHQQFKRSCLPDGPKVGSVTLSPRGDWRMPSDASAALWLDLIRKA
ncbi:MAG: NAD(+) synthase [Solobacterium sp.]|jgi:NAD+ synthase (glutamine-hydrolysing)|nr:NAD(+) synthase [Solobacterium sp.]MCH4226352.1 NAD(+) synthase [Solobacterium sp.]MCH4281753.1 NAD(+) synthase [Solobacterium sp.]